MTCSYRKIVIVPMKNHTFISGNVSAPCREFLYSSSSRFKLSFESQIRSSTLQFGTLQFNAYNILRPNWDFGLNSSAVLQALSDQFIIQDWNWKLLEIDLWKQSGKSDFKLKIVFLQSLNFWSVFFLSFTVILTWSLLN